MEPKLIVCGVIIIIGFGISGYIGIRDAIRASRYSNATICKGTVISSLGVKSVMETGNPEDREAVFETYDVTYIYNGEEKRGKVFTKETGLRDGASIDVHVYDKRGHHDIMSELFVARTHFRLFGIICIALLLGIGYLIFFAPH